VLQCVAACFSVLQCVAVNRSVSQCVAPVLQGTDSRSPSAVQCCVLQMYSGAMAHVHLVCCSVLQCVAVCSSVLQCVPVCCNVLQCVAG